MRQQRWSSAGAVVGLYTPKNPSAGCTAATAHPSTQLLTQREKAFSWMWETADPMPNSQTPAPLYFVFPHKTLKGFISLGSIKAIIDNKQENFLSQNPQFNSWISSSEPSQMQVKNLFARQTSLWNYAPEVEQACQQKALQGISASLSKVRTFLSLLSACLADTIYFVLLKERMIRNAWGTTTCLWANCRC